MYNLNKYLSLMALIIGSFLSFLLLLVLFFYVMKLFSIAFFSIPGSTNIFETVIILVPYILYYAAYYYLAKKITLAKTSTAKILGSVFVIIGTSIATVTLTLAFMVFFKLHYPWLKILESNSHYAFIVQIIIIFFAAGTIASGDAREKDWMERGSSEKV